MKMFKSKFEILYESVMNSLLNEDRFTTDYVQQLKNFDNKDEIIEYLKTFNDTKKEKAVLKWLKNGSVKFPVEDTTKVDKALDLLDKQNLDLNNFNSPDEVLDRNDKSTVRILAQNADFDPDKEPTFYNRKDLGKGYVVYNVKDTKEGQVAVRKAIDVNWGYDKNPWCLAERDHSTGKCKNFI